jgi:hypothetical protein
LLRVLDHFVSAMIAVDSSALIAILFDAPKKRAKRARFSPFFAELFTLWPPQDASKLLRRALSPHPHVLVCHDQWQH